MVTLHDGHIGIDLRAVADGHTVSDISEGTHIDIFSDLGLWRYKGQGIDAVLLGLGSLVEL